MKRFTLAVATAVALLFGSAAQAGPIIIAGTDADDHGGVSGGVNQTGWLFMQKSFENLLPAVTNSGTTVVCLGCNTGEAQDAFASAFDLATKPAGWTRATLTTNADITNFFNGTGTVNVNNAGLVYMPTVSNNVGGGITSAQLGVVNANAAVLNAFVTGGGGLFTQEQANLVGSGGYGWLTALLPGLSVFGDNQGGIADSGSLSLTAAGSTAFPGLTNADLSNATPWHAYFTGNFGGLGVLVTGNGDDQGLADAVVLGGGAGTVIQCGLPGQPPCPTVPEPGSLPLLALASLGLVAAGARRRKGA